MIVNPGGGLPPAEPTGIPFLDARHRIARVATAVVGPAATYLENLAAPWSADRITREGVVAYPVPEQAPLPWVALDDVASAIAAALADPEPRQVQLVAGAPLTGAELAGALAGALGRDIAYRAIDPAEYRELLAPHLGEHAAAGVAGMYAGEPGPPPADEVLVAAPGTVAAWAARHLPERLAGHR